MPSVKRLRMRSSSQGSGKAKKSARVEVVGKERIEAMIDRKLRRVYERKEYVQYTTNQSLGSITGTGNLALNSFFFAPVLQQGTSVSARIGNVIRWETCKINLIVNLKPYDITINPKVAPYMVRVLLVQSKGNPKTNALSQTVAATNFFSYGGGTTGFTNSPLDILAEPNWEEWRLLDDRKFKLGITGAQSIAGTTPGTIMAFDQSNFTQRIEFDISNIVKGKRLVYDDGQNFPTNGGYYCIIQMVPADGTSGIDACGEYHLYHRSTYSDA